MILSVFSLQILTMEKVYSIFFTLLSSMTVFSQRADLDKYNFNASYIELPKMVVDTSYRTYFVEIDASPALKKDLPEENLEEYVSIEGWKRLSGIGHVKIFTRLEDVFIENVEVKERVEILKDKNGKETGRKSHYYLQMEYTFAAQAKMTDYKGNQLATFNLANRESRQTYNSKEFSSFIEASLYYKFRGLDFPKLIADRAVKKAMNYLSNDLNYNLGFSPRTVTDFLWILDSKRHPEYTAHRKAWTVFKQAMFQMSAEEPLDQVKQTLIPVISYFEKIKKTYSSDSKADKKLRYASYFNLAKIYYYLDDPDAVMREAGELMVNEFDEKDGKRLESAAVALKALFKESKFNSRHFPIDKEKYSAPQELSVH
jgi:hypothetical protein